MKQFLRPILCGGMLAALLCTPSLAADEGDFSLLVNGEPVTFSDAAPVLKDGRSFLPMAATFEALGFPADQITWDGEARTVTAVKPDVTYINFTLDRVLGSDCPDGHRLQYHLGPVRGEHHRRSPRSPGPGSGGLHH